MIRCAISSPGPPLLEQVNAAVGDDTPGATSSAVQVTRHTGEHISDARELVDGDVLVVEMCTHTDDGDLLVVNTQYPDPKNSEGWMVVESPTSSQVPCLGLPLTITITARC